MIRQLTLGSSGLRGMVGAGLNPSNAAEFTAAFATLIPGGRVLVGVDPRTSSEMLRCAVLAGLSGAGCEVIDGGVLTAGMMHCLIPTLGLDGGILISGGHQTAGWNALIPLAPDGAYFNRLRQQELFDVYQSRRYREAAAADVRPVRMLEHRALDKYWDFLASRLDCAAIAAAKLKVVADFCNGSGAAFAARFARLVGIELVAVNNTPSGVIPRDPEPRPRSESLIRSIIKPLNAAAGLVFNRDLSRMGIVTENGEPLSEELTFPLAADYYFDRLQPGFGVVSNNCSTLTLDDVVARHGGILHKTRVGQAAGIDLMLTSEAAAAGEGSGSFTVAGMNGFDGFLMAGILLEALAKRGRSLSVQLNALKRYHIVKQKIPCTLPHAHLLLGKLRREFGDDVRISDLDGLRFDWPDGFLSLRLSNTEPLLRLISESRRKEAAEERAWRARLLLEHQGM